MSSLPPAAVSELTLVPKIRPPTEDPHVPDWAHMPIPNAWSDEVVLFSFRGVWILVSHVVRSVLQIPLPIVLPKNLPLREELPAYLVQNFHGIPNGYFSHKVASTYHLGFEIATLGLLNAARNWQASTLSRCKAVLDVGCGVGALAQKFIEQKIPEVWGIDPCPYALNVAARNVPKAQIVQGLAEDLPFAAQRFDGIGVTYMMHEVPIEIAHRAFNEFRRVLKPGGKLVLVEPARYQMQTPFWKMLLKFDIRGLYFKVLANCAYEPYVRDWHKQNLEEWLTECGFDVLENCEKTPFRRILARKA